MNTTEYTYLKKKIRDLTVFDLDNYSDNQMMRRLDSYIARTKVKDIAQYCKLLERDAHELEKLQNFLTVNVSEFFRDPPYFDILQNTVLPDLLRRSEALNIWSAGCSNGAEAYSVAMILSRVSPLTAHRILATDIDKRILELAEAGGPYRPSDIRNVPKPLVKKYFSARDNSFWVCDDIRKKVTFKRHDLMQDVFGVNFDLIICRNVVIYFSDEAKVRLKWKFQNALKPNGILFIGATETMIDAADVGFHRMFHCVYRKHGANAVNLTGTRAQPAIHITSR